VPAVPLPDDLIKRFDGKGMAVVGYETDSVRKTPQGDISVPINMVRCSSLSSNQPPLAPTMGIGPDQHGAVFVLRQNQHSRMPLVPTPARLKLLHVLPMAFLSGATFLPVHIVNCVKTLQAYERAG
jgi:hypothetical protein